MTIFYRSRRRRKIILYGKPGCHLCDDARELLERLNKRYPLEVEEIDITSDPRLFRTYDIFIPVIVIDGKYELRAPLDEKELVRALRTWIP